MKKEPIKSNLYPGIKTKDAFSFGQSFVLPSMRVSMHFRKKKPG